MLFLVFSVIGDNCLFNFCVEWKWKWWVQLL